MKKYNINDEDLGVNYQDSGPWRSYSLDAHGDSASEMVEEATISETDQDGGTLDCYGIADCSKLVEERVLNMIEELILRKDAYIAQTLEEQKIKGNDL